MPVDARENIYLKGYGPTSIKVNDVELKRHELIDVNGEEIMVGEFFENLKNVENHSFEVLKNNRKISFSILMQQVCEEHREYGYLIENERFSPFADLVEPDIPALVGPCIRYDLSLASSITGATLPILVSIIDSSHEDEKLDQLEVEVLVRFLNNINMNPSLKNFTIQKVNKFKTIKSNPAILSFLRRAA